MTDAEKDDADKDALDKAKEVIAKLKKGETFENLAKEYSDDEATKEKGGSLGLINKESYGSDVFDNEVYKLKVGTYSQTPIKTTRGYEVVYVTKEAKKASLEDVREKIVDKLYTKVKDEDATTDIVALRDLRKEKGMSIVDDELKQQYSKYINRAYNSAVSENNKNKK